MQSPSSSSLSITADNANYISTPWIKVRTDAGAEEWISPAELTRTASGAVPVDLVSVDAFFHTATLEALIGLVQEAFAPADEAEWLDRFVTPPTAATLADALRPLTPHFFVYGDAPAFQDASLDGEEEGVTGLFLTTPGDQTRKFNSDVLIRDTGPIDLRLAMVALVGGHSYATAAGRGSRTSLSGGGPLRTLVDGDTLWRKVWANVLMRDAFEALGNGATDPVSRYPWLAFRTDAPTPETAPASHVYFACPRRVKLSRPSNGFCSLTLEASLVVSDIRMAANGPAYDSIQWRHPLTPYVRRRDKDGLHAYPRLAANLANGCAWHEWHGFTQPVGEITGPGLVPALAVAQWTADRLYDLDLPVFDIVAFGLQASNATILGQVCSRFPVLAIGSDHLADYRSGIERMVNGGISVANLLKDALKAAESDSSGKKTFVADSQVIAVASRFWHATRGQFLVQRGQLRDLLSKGMPPASSAVVEVFATLHTQLTAAALAIFDDVVDVTALPDPEIACQARRKLGNFLHGKVTKGAFGLDTGAADSGNPVPAKKKGKK